MANPLLLVTNPDNLASGVPANTIITATFDQAMDASTISGLTFIVNVENSITDVLVGDVDYLHGERKARFTPLALLNSGIEYRATLIGGSIKNAFGAPLISNPTWTFIASSITIEPTGAGSDLIATSGALPATGIFSAETTSLSVIETVPVDVAASVVLTQGISLYFNDDLWLENISAASVTGMAAGALSDPTGWLTATVAIEAEAALGTPWAGFTPNTPQFGLTYDLDTNIALLTPTGTGHVGSSYSGGVFSQGTSTSGVWEPMTDYIITVTKDRIKGLDTSTLTPDYSFFFTTILSPMYTSIQIIRMDLGSFIDSVPDNTIALLIHRNSVYAQTLGTISSPVQTYARQYVTCKTELDLINALYLGIGKLGSGRRTLGDMSITKDAGGVQDLIGPIREGLLLCVKEAMALIKTGGSGVVPRHAVPHLNQREFPGFPDTWMRMDQNDDAPDGQYKPSTTIRAGRNITYPFKRRRNI